MIAIRANPDFLDNFGSASARIVTRFPAAFLGERIGFGQLKPIGFRTMRIGLEAGFNGDLKGRDMGGNDLAARLALIHYIRPECLLHGGADVPAASSGN